MGRVIRKWLRYAVTFYLTAPLLGCYIAVAVTMKTAWDEENPFLAVASGVVGVSGTLIFAAGIFAVRRLIGKGPS